MPVFPANTQVVTTASTEQFNRVCAWCQVEAGAIPQANETHGICQRHAQEALAELATLHLVNQC